MKRPSFLTYIYSNPVVLIGLSGLTLWQVCAALKGEVSYFVPFVLACFAGGSSQASERVQKFHRWNAEWNLMHGIRPFRIRIPGLRFIVGGAIWAVAAFYLRHHGSESGPSWVLPSFWLGTSLLVIGAIYFLAKRVGGMRDGRPRDVAVMLCLAKPSQASTVYDAYAALPNYCAALFRRDAGAA